MSIYYHFYIATAQASIRSLKRIYKWAVKQTVIPLQITDYIDKVNDFNATVIAKNINAADPRWLIANNKTLREFRWPIALGIPDLDKSINVIGFIAHNKDYYVHLGAGDNSWISFSQILPAQPYLIDANAEIDQWDIINDKSIQFSLQGYVPLDFSLANMQGCQLEHNGQILKTTDTNRYHIKDANNGAFKIHCTR